MPQQLSAVILPAALPTIVVGIRLASASVMRVLVASDVKGLFHHQEPVQFLIPQMYPRDYSRRAYVQCHPAGDRGTFHTMESAGLCLMVSRAPLQGTDELVAPFSNRCIYQHMSHPRSWSAIVSADCFLRRKRWKKIESGRLASLTAGCVRAHSGRTGTVIVPNGTHARSSVTGSRNWATVSVRMSSHSNDRPCTVTS